MFVTFFLGMLDLKNGELTYTNAGHNPPVILKKDGETAFFEKTKGIPAGLFEEAVYEESVIKLSHGDKIFLYTDGVTEAENMDHQLFGDHNLINVLRLNAPLSPRDLIRQVEEALSGHVNGYTQSDDITMMTISLQ
jgi:sigma-B regulation protein RsbU (phosphoserine phosphatase)